MHACAYRGRLSLAQGSVSIRIHKSHRLPTFISQYTLPQNFSSSWFDHCSDPLQIAPVAPTALDLLAKKLLQVAQNPTQPGFNHFLFESVAALIRCTHISDSPMPLFYLRTAIRTLLPRGAVLLGAHMHFNMKPIVKTPSK